MQAHKIKNLLIASGCLIIASCNTGGGSTTDVQNGTLNNGVVNISYTATNCRTIAANGGSCSVEVSYNWIGSAPTNVYLALYNSTNTPVANYSNNLYTNTPTPATPACSSAFTTSRQNCTFTITSQGSTSSAQIAYIAPNNPSTAPANNSLSFTLGGGLNN